MNVVGAFGEVGAEVGGEVGEEGFVEGEPGELLAFADEFYLGEFFWSEAYGESVDDGASVEVERCSHGFDGCWRHVDFFLELAKECFLWVFSLFNSTTRQVPFIGIENFRFVITLNHDKLLIKDDECFCAGFTKRGHREEVKLLTN